MLNKKISLFLIIISFIFNAHVFAIDKDDGLYAKFPYARFVYDVMREAQADIVSIKEGLKIASSGILDEDLTEARHVYSQSLKTWKLFKDRKCKTDDLKKSHLSSLVKSIGLDALTYEQKESVYTLNVMPKRNPLGEWFVNKFTCLESFLPKRLQSISLPGMALTALMVMSQAREVAAKCTLPEGSYRDTCTVESSARAISYKGEELGYCNFNLNCRTMASRENGTHSYKTTDVYVPKGMPPYFLENCDGIPTLRETPEVLCLTPKKTLSQASIFTPPLSVLDCGYGAWPPPGCDVTGESVWNDRAHDRVCIYTLNCSHTITTIIEGGKDRLDPGVRTKEKLEESQRIVLYPPFSQQLGKRLIEMKEKIRRHPSFKKYCDSSAACTFPHAFPECYDTDSPEFD